MERAEKSRQSAHSRAAAEPSAANAAAPIADHRSAATAQRALAGWVAQRAGPEEELQMKRSPAQLAAPEEELQLKSDPAQRAAVEEEPEPMA